MKSYLYTPSRRTNESWKKHYAGRVEAQRTSGHNQGHSQVGKKKIDLLNMNEVDQCREDGRHLASQT